MGLSFSNPKEVKPSSYWSQFLHDRIPQSLYGKCVAVTGCTSGTGRIFALEAARRGAHVLLLNRPSERADAVYAEVVKEAGASGGAGKVTKVACDLGSFASVQKACETVKREVPKLHVLCNNAGVMALQDKATEDGHDVQMQTNHLSHFLLTRELMPLLERAAATDGEARVVNHSSIARKSPPGPLERKYLEKNGGNLGGDSQSLSGARWVRYQQTKLANCVFTYALHDRLVKAKSQVKAVVAHPGVSSTNLLTTSFHHGGFMIARLFSFFAQSAEDGTQGILAAAFEPGVQSGTFWGPHGMNGMRGKAEPVEPEKECTDERAKEMLWEASEKATWFQGGTHWRI
uniref:Oxidoreductase n=1 Tax=Chromera velia CCMP2878 TaxID=1169474 RepID=A0A0G4IF92_9ALVE|eukprot:Cvel_13841.t1-p1 / transcript=Cvel_13841.t1 / gene=Cvel_13841 / organism=Chromera_velia_CCMP2878 / gene_product=Retinol dehydrogenase 14, putative / transcript_product=Retinol dehydrogenase 14, putative / location=Cvel_scaffold961:42792-45856(+) / protein_length=344 / sequence_SO=supercontig / SO=protein_coding / is_pseudo=false